MKKKKQESVRGFSWIFFSKLVGSSFFCCLDVYTNYLYKGKKTAESFRQSLHINLYKAPSLACSQLLAIAVQANDIFLYLCL